MAVVCLTGDIDIANVAETFAAVPRRSAQSLVLDLSDVTFIGSMGLNQLVVLAKEMELRIVAPSGHEPRRILDMMEVTGWIPTFDTVDQALAAG
jgi:anti-anti-sigma factor